MSRGQSDSPGPIPQGPPGPRKPLYTTAHQPKEGGSQRRGENIHLRIYYNTSFPNTKEGDRTGIRECPRWGRGSEVGRPSPEGPGAMRGDLPPLLRWTFQQIIGGGRVHSGGPLMPGRWAGRRGGRAKRDLERAGALPAPRLGQWVEVTREGLLPAAQCRQHGGRGRPRQDLLSSQLLTSTSVSRATPSTRPRTEATGLCSPGQGRREGRTGRGTCPQGGGAQPVALSTVSWTA